MLRNHFRRELSYRDYGPGPLIGLIDDVDSYCQPPIRRRNSLTDPTHLRSVESLPESTPEGSPSPKHKRKSKTGNYGYPAGGINIDGQNAENQTRRIQRSTEGVASLRDRHLDIAQPGE